MKSAKFNEELQAKSIDALKQELTDAKKELFNLRFQTVTGQISNPSRIGACKKDIARIKTILRQRELAGSAE